MKNFEIYNAINLFLLAILAIRIFWNQNEKTIILIVLTSLFSVLCSLEYLILNAPDVAITEISIGACITTIFLLKSASYLKKNNTINDDHSKILAYSAKAFDPPIQILHKLSFSNILNCFGGSPNSNKCKSKDDNVPNKIIKFIIFIGFFTIFILFFEKASFHFPTIISDELPFLYNNTIKYYIQQTKDFLQFPNIVTAIIISFRGYDTFIETIVILTAGISVVSILSKNETIKEITKSTLFDKTVISNMVMMIIPFIILFAFYIQAHGKESPGGGFQSGSILASAIIGSSLTISEDLIRKYLQNKRLMRIGATGVFLYFIIGLIPMFRDHNFLDHNYVVCSETNLLLECHAKSQKISIFIAELGVGMTVFSVMTIIFFNLKLDRKNV